MERNGALVEVAYPYLHEFQRVVLDKLGGELTLRSHDDPDRVLTLKETERKALVRASRSAGGNVTKAAQLVGMPPGTLYRKLREHRLVASEYRRPWTTAS